MRAQLTDLKTSMAQIGARIDTLESRINTMNTQVLETRSSVETLVGNTRIPKTGLPRSPSDGAGTRVQPTHSSTDPESGFVNDDAVESYRKAMALFDARKYPESVLGFSSFLDKYPDHPLAGSAQFYVGEAYFEQKEYRLALQEFKRVLTSYDRSSHVADTLRDMAECEDALKLPEDAARHRQLLTSLFPQSPAAAMPMGSAAKDAKGVASAASGGALDGVPAAPADKRAQAAAAPRAAQGAANGALPLDAPPAPAAGAGSKAQTGAVPTAPMTGDSKGP